MVFHAIHGISKYHYLVNVASIWTLFWASVIHLTLYLSPTLLLFPLFLNVTIISSHDVSCPKYCIRFVISNIHSAFAARLIYFDRPVQIFTVSNITEVFPIGRFVRSFQQVRGSLWRLTCLLSMRSLFFLCKPPKWWSNSLNWTCVNHQLNTQFFYSFLITSVSLHSTTCFEHRCAHPQEEIVQE